MKLKKNIKAGILNLFFKVILIFLYFTLNLAVTEENENIKKYTKIKFSTK